MSYDTDIRVPGCPTCGRPEDRIDLGNMTCNVSSMWTLALGFPLHDMHGRKASKCIADLERAVAHIRAPENREAYVAMNPPNKWGDHDGAARYLEGILEGCKKWPNGTLELSY